MLMSIITTYLFKRKKNSRKIGVNCRKEIMKIITKQLLCNVNVLKIAQ